MHHRRKFLKTLALAGASLSIGNISLAQNTNKNTESQHIKGANMSIHSSSNQVWYITGASGGLGLELAKYLLSKGDRVAATSRKLSNIESKLGKESEQFLPLELGFYGDMNAKIAKNMESLHKKFGRLDNVVNNAGYGLLGFVEEVSEKQLREQFEVNVFAPFLVAQNALKIMRPQAMKEGGNTENIRARIFNLSSIGGFRVSNNSTPYCMSKFAISALSEGLMLDVGEYGIHTINVMPAGFRTQFLGASMVLGEGRVNTYDTRRKDFEKRSANYNGKQAGNPQKFAEILYQISRMPKPPFNLFMGEAAFKSAKNKIAFVQRDIESTESYASKAADFADAAGSAFDKR